MPTTHYIPSNGSSNGTSNVMGLLFPAQQEALMLIKPQHMEDVFGPGAESIYEPERGYEDPEWYFESSDGCIWGIGWRWGQARLRARGKRGTTSNALQLRHPSQTQAIEFVEYLARELV